MPPPIYEAACASPSAGTSAAASTTSASVTPSSFATAGMCARSMPPLSFIQFQHVCGDTPRPTSLSAAWSLRGVSISSRASPPESIVRRRRDCDMLNPYLSSRRASSLACAGSGDSLEMPIDYAEMGARLRAAREAKRPKLTQKAAAKKLGMTPQNVSLIEQGSVSTSMKNIEQYAALVGCRLAIVLARAGDKRALTAARLVELLPVLDESVFETLEGSVALWEAKHGAGRREGAGSP